jgi:hypothetical protein
MDLQNCSYDREQALAESAMRRFPSQGGCPLLMVAQKTPTNAREYGASEFGPADASAGYEEFGRQH